MTENVSKAIDANPFDWYTNSSVFARERREIFDREWQAICPLSQLIQPGDWVRQELCGVDLLAVAQDDGSVRAFHNICRHRAAPLVETSSGNNRRFICPYHGWVYEGDGRLVAAPGVDREGLRTENNCAGLLPIQVEIWNGIVWGRIEKQHESLTDWLGDVVTIANDYPPTNDFEFATCIVNEARCNWKTYGDNSAEGYHLEYVHQELNASLLGNAQITTYPKGGFVGFDVRYGESANDKGFWIYKFPGVLLHLSMDSFNLERVTPVAPDRIRLSRWFWFAQHIDADERDRRIQFSNRVMNQDIGICERVQKNLTNGHLKHGLLVPTREPGTVFIQHLIRKRLDGKA